MHPEIFLPFAKKVIFPGTGGNDAVITTDFRNSTRLDADETVKNPFIAAD
jgi:hypothetical protein